MVGPWIHFFFPSVVVPPVGEVFDDDMSDIQYLAVKEFDGKLVTNTNVQDDGATGNTATLTATAAKDLYLAKATVTIRVDSSGNSLANAEITLVANGVTKDRFYFSGASWASAGSGSTVSELQHTFNVSGIKVAATQTIIIDVISSNAIFDISGTLTGFEEDTGVTPRLPAGSATITGALAGDVGFLAKKEFDGKLRSDEGSLSATGDLATLTATAAKDMYLARAKCVFYMNTTNGVTVNDTVELKINGIVIETAKATMSLSSADLGGSITTVVYEFANIGHKVLATQIIKLEVTVLDAQTDVEGFIECFEEDTGTSPTA